MPDTVTVIDEVFITAPQKINGTGGKIIMIDSMILENKSFSDLSGLLSENTSVFIKSHGKGSMATASIRGTNSSHTHVLWNDIPLNSPVLGMVDMSTIPACIANSIYLYYGPASVQKSGGALGGIIDVNTSADFSNRFNAEIQSSYGSYSSFGNSVGIKTGSAKFQSHTKLYKFSAENNFEFINNDIVNGNIQKHKNADYDQTGILQEFYYLFDNNSSASVKLWHQKMDRGIPFLTTNETGNDANINRQFDENTILSAGYVFYGNNFSLEYSGGLNIQGIEYFHKNYIRGSGHLKIIDSNTSSQSVYNSLKYDQKAGEHFEIRTEFGFNFHDVSSIEKVRNEGYSISRNELILMSSVFTDIIKNHNIGGNLRYERTNDNFSGIIPSLYVSYEFSDQLAFKSSLARNLKYPNLNELYFTPGGNPELKPEQGFQVDGSFEFHKNISSEISLFAEITGFYSRIKDWIIWRPTNMGFWQPDNISNVEAKGVELSIRSAYNAGNFILRALGNYAYTRSVNKSEPFGPNDKSVGKQLPYIPEHSANALIRFDYNNFFMTYQWNYFSERYTGSAAEPGVLVSIYPYFMNDMSIGKNFFTDKFRLNLSFFVNNIFNESYRSVLWQPMPGRNYQIRFVVQYGK